MGISIPCPEVLEPGGGPAWQAVVPDLLPDLAWPCPHSGPSLLTPSWAQSRQVPLAKDGHLAQLTPATSHLPLWRGPRLQPSAPLPAIAPPLPPGGSSLGTSFWARRSWILRRTLGLYSSKGHLGPNIGQGLLQAAGLCSSLLVLHQQARGGLWPGPPLLPKGATSSRGSSGLLLGESPEASVPPCSGPTI